MSQFGTKSLLVGVAMLAAWLSTFSGYEAGQDVRRSVLLLIVSASVFAAIYFRGRRQPFWIGFSAAPLLLAIRPQWQFVPGTSWARQTAQNWALQFPTGPLPPNIAPSSPGDPLRGRQRRVNGAIVDTIWLAFALPLSIVVGLIGACIYDIARKPSHAKTE